MQNINFFKGFSFNEVASSQTQTYLIYFRLKCKNNWAGKSSVLSLCTEQNFKQHRWKKKTYNNVRTSVKHHSVTIGCLLKKITWEHTALQKTILIPCRYPTWKTPKKAEVDEQRKSQFLPFLWWLTRLSACCRQSRWRYGCHRTEGRWLHGRRDLSAPVRGKISQMKRMKMMTRAELKNHTPVLLYTPQRNRT